jgi:hypothetical protein
MSKGIKLSTQETVKIIGKLFPSIKAAIAKEALEYGENRGGLAVGFKDEEGDIHSLTSIVNPHLPSRWGEEEDQYDLYATLKLGTALRTEASTKKLAPERAPLVAVHPGGVVGLDEKTGLWFGVAYSGHSGEEDEELALRMFKRFFFE